ncbi:MaoC/PaaZ C-terminal domain-containing protein [Micromonospora sp. DT233]|uniref:MaoC/PaaZ C-terminal domain-containing protein n=1 Tax=Micromonospora sp. DT233 TaxID=3393432 RepID=UPI003CF4663C
MVTPETSPPPTQGPPHPPGAVAQGPVATDAGPEAQEQQPQAVAPAGAQRPPAAPVTIPQQPPAAAPGGHGEAAPAGVTSPPVAAMPVSSGTGARAELFFEDLHPGRTFDLGVVAVDGDEMVAFARRFDPQWYHVDAERAAASHHGGLIASGFYTVSLFMRAYVDHVLARAAADASPGLEELRWLAPVRAGDRLAVRLDVAGSRPSTARPGLGTVSLTGTMFRLGPDGQPEREVLRTRFRGWFALRPSSD